MNNEWTEPLKKLPIPYDLVFLKTNRGNFNGWWNGTNWEGLRIKANDIVSGWVRSVRDNE